MITILQAILPMGGPLLESSQSSDLLAFPDLMIILQTLAGAGSGYGHVLLFQTAQQWLELW